MSHARRAVPLVPEWVQASWATGSITWDDGTPVPLEAPSWAEQEWCDEGATCEHAGCLEELAGVGWSAETGGWNR